MPRIKSYCNLQGSTRSSLCMSSNSSMVILSIVYDTTFTLAYFCPLNIPRSSSLSLCTCCIFCLHHPLPSIFLYSFLLLTQDSMQILPPHQRTSLVALAIAALLVTYDHITLFSHFYQLLKLAYLIFVLCVYHIFHPYIPH